MVDRVLCLETSLANDRMLIWATILFVLVQLFVVVSMNTIGTGIFLAVRNCQGMNEISKTVKVFF